VEEVTIYPSAAEMNKGDTLSYSVELLPENATVKDFWFMMDGDPGVLEQDSANSRLFAREAGTAGLILFSVSGALSDTLLVTVSDHTSYGPGSEFPTFRVFPNPSNGILRLECGDQEKVEMQLLDLNGKVLTSCEYQDQTEIDTAHLAAGTYLLVQRWKDHIKRHKVILY